MKKIAIIAGIIALLSGVAQAKNYIDALYGMDIRVGYDSCSMSEFGNAYLNLFNSGYGIKEQGTGMDRIFIKNINLKWFPTRNIALNVKNELLVLENSDVLRDVSVNLDSIESKAVMKVYYAGIGPKFYMGIDAMPGFFPFFGADAGLMMHAGSYWEVTARPGTSYYKPEASLQKIEIEGMFFGATAETGFEWLYKEVGFNVGGGYRYAVCRVDKPASLQGIFKNEQLKFETIDFSGIFVTAGLTFYYSPTK